MGNCIRSCVSKKKKRLVIGADGTDAESGLKSHEGCDLDLSLVHKRIVAMGFPSVGVESCYRNPRDDVIELLDENFGKHYKVYNLCSESDRQYDPVIFGNRVSAHIQWPDHLPPTLEMLCRLIIDDALSYLNQDSKNVAAIHCKAGKGRTGVAVCCLLLATGAAPNGFEQALSMYGVARTRNAQGVTIPSQKRYVKYFDLFLKRRPTTSTSVAKPTITRTAHDVDDVTGDDDNNNNINNSVVNCDQVSPSNNRNPFTSSEIRLQSIKIKGFKHIHILRRNSRTGRTVEVLTLTKELTPCVSNRSGDDDALTWFELDPTSLAEPTSPERRQGDADESVVNNNCNSNSSENEREKESANDDDDEKVEAELSSKYAPTNFVDSLQNVKLKGDFCLAFGNEKSFPSKCMMLWLHAEFCCSEDDSQESFNIDEIDGWKMFFDKSENEEILKVKFSKW